MCVWCTWLEDQYPDALDPNLMDKKVDTFHEDIPPLFAVMEKKNCIFWEMSHCQMLGKVEYGLPAKI